MKPHKHAELIKAWADGAEIQTRIGIKWVDCLHPDWIGSVEYRIKPAAQVYPETTMTRDDFLDILRKLRPRYDPMEACVTFANAGIKHAIDTALVAPMDAYIQCANDLRRAEDTLRLLGYQDCGGELWKPPLGAAPRWARQP